MASLFHQGLRVVSQCPLCGSSFKPGETSVLETKDGTHLIYVRCISCSGALIALVNFKEGSSRTVGVVTDLHKDEILKYRSAVPVDADDVLSVHEAFHAHAVGNELDQI